MRTTLNARCRPVVLAILAGLLAAGCVARLLPAPTLDAYIPSVAESEALLARIVERAEAHDWEGLCALGSGTCTMELDLIGRDAVPAEPPRVVGDRVLLPAQVSGGQSAAGGRVLIICGTDGRGRPYRSEVLVFRSDGLLLATNAVYWGGGRIGDASNPVAAPTVSVSPGC